MFYDVRAVPRAGHDGRNRGGRRFSTAYPTRLEASEVTPEMLADPLLIVSRVEDAESDQPHSDTADELACAYAEVGILRVAVAERDAQILALQEALAAVGRDLEIADSKSGAAASLAEVVKAKPKATERKPAH